VPTEPLSPAAIAPIVELALREDLNAAPPTAGADLTAAWVVPEATPAEATIIARQQGVVCGLEVARAVFRRLDEGVAMTDAAPEGGVVRAQSVLARLRGPARALLAGERTALNFLQHLCGVASLTRAFVEAVAGTRARITDTRKTTPGLRLLEKYAVRCGGGVNHRFGLYDAVLIKENHAASVDGVDEAVRRARQAARREGRSALPLMAEARDLSEVRSLLTQPPDRILLDNMPLEPMREAVRLIRQAAPEVEIEATGGVALATVRAVALTGVDLISVGALTHSAPALDLSLLFTAADASGAPAGG
jgi:nicotinate-nucleotide pyrophosphorylase (carboxylating)